MNTGDCASRGFRLPPVTVAASSTTAMAVWTSAATAKVPHRMETAVATFMAASMESETEMVATAAQRFRSVSWGCQFFSLTNRPKFKELKCVLIFVLRPTEWDDDRRVQTFHQPVPERPLHSHTDQLPLRMQHGIPAGRARGMHR